MDTTMELDELKQAWQTLDKRLQQQNALQFQLLRDKRIDKMKSSLRPLFVGQVVQILFGVWMVLIGVDVWASHRDVMHLLIAGIVMHAYGVATIVAGGIVCGGIAGIDHAAPVLELQRRLAKLRKQYILSGMCVGLPWWVMWVPFVMTLAMSATGIDIYAVARASSPIANWVDISIGVGVLGLLGTWAFHRWSRHPSRAELGRKLEDGAAGGSLRRAQAELDALTQYAEE
jgi:serine/threonine-protein kinase